MRMLLAIFGISTTIQGLAAPAYADPGDPSGDDAGFQLLCNKSASSSPSPAAAVGAGKAVCGCLNNGESGLELVHDVKIRNAGFTMEDASDFAMIAAKFYCPQQLSRG